MINKISFFLLGLFLLSGCGGILNPYDSKSDAICPKSSNGKCVSLIQAYEESIENKDKKTENKKVSKIIKSSKENEILADDLKIPENSSDLYQEALNKKMAKLINDPVTPIVVPPTAMRVLIFPYQSGNVFYMHRFIHFLDNTPRFVLGNKPGLMEQLID